MAERRSIVTRSGGGAPDVRRPRSLGPSLADVELHAVAFAQRVDAFAVDGAGMEEHFLAGTVANETESLVGS